jgi:hypothetical protein
MSEAVSSCKTSVIIYQAARCNISQYSYHSTESRKSHLSAWSVPWYNSQVFQVSPGGGNLTKHSYFCRSPSGIIN